MPSDGGITSEIEVAMVGVLEALENNDKTVFKTAEQWDDQFDTTAGGLEKFDRFAPLAFVAFGDAGSNRLGGYDLEQQLRFAVLIGTESKAAGIARTGDAKHLGISKIRDLVIAAFDKLHPGNGLTCNSIYYDGEYKLVDQPKRQAQQLNFTVGYIG